MGGSESGTGGAMRGGSGGAALVDAGGGQGGAEVDAAATGGADAGNPIGPGAPGQGPNAEGTIVFSRDFEDGSMAGLSRSPNNLPVDRIQIDGRSHQAAREGDAHRVPRRRQLPDLGRHPAA